jgi:hypothetical protein
MSQVSQAERLFVGVFYDLCEKHKKADEYSLIKASGLIRQLFFDSKSLVDTVNVKFKLKLRYKIYDKNKEQYIPKIFLDSGVYWANPKGSPKETCHDLKFNEFVSRIVFAQKGNVLTIKDAIKITANMLGGVHFDTVIEPELKETIELSKYIIVNDKDSFNNILHSIYEIMIQSITELKNKIEEQGGFEPLS